MEKKIKVIDLLNKIANGEEIPKLKLEYTDDNDIGYELYSRIGLTNEYDFKNCLNEEIEIIEEDKEISKITKEEFERLDKRTLLELIIKNQNEIIDEVNELKKEGK